MRQIVVSCLRPLDAMSVENSARPGTPDVECELGWLELKEMGRWPKSPELPLRVTHFRPGQRVWLKRRWRAGGACYVLLKVKHDWLLFAGDVGADIIGKATQEQLRAAALMTWTSRTVKRGLLEWLKVSTRRVQRG
jgi:hypothetical protein